MYRQCMAVAPLFRVDVELAAYHLAKMYDGRPPTRARSKQWRQRIRVWAHRYPTELHRYERIGSRTQYDLEQIDSLALKILGAPLDRSSIAA